MLIFICKTRRFILNRSLKRLHSNIPVYPKYNQIRNTFRDINSITNHIPKHKSLYFVKSMLGNFLSLAIFIGTVMLVLSFIPDKNLPIFGTYYDEILPGANVSSLPTFNDVCGNDEIKEDLMDIVSFLRNPEKFVEMKIKIPKGILMTGEPGCGKTLMARALAGEAGVPFIFCSGTSFEQMVVGLGAKRIRELFKKARKMAPCIIFIDEIDALTERKNSISNIKKGTINQLLSELDGFKPSDGVVIVAATNKVDQLDKALTRSGRFDRTVKVSRPDHVARKKMFDMFFADKYIEPSVSTKELAMETSGFTGADIFNIVNTAATETIKRKSDMITTEDIREAISIIAMGRPRRFLELGKDFKRATAFHEAGHTIVSMLGTKHGDVSQVTVLPRGQSLGATYHAQKQDNEFQISKLELLEEMDVCMGGYVAEEIVYGKENTSSGASNDFQKATEIAKNLILVYGLGQSLGRLSLPHQLNAFLPDQIQIKVNEEVKMLLKSSYQRSKKVITENIDAFNDLAEKLFERETLSKEDIKKIINK